MRGIDLEVDGLPVDALVVSCYPRGLILDLALDLGEVVELPPWNMEELSPFLLSSNARGRMGNVNLIIFVGIVAFAG